MPAVDLPGRVEHVGVDAGRDEVQDTDARALQLAPQRLAERHHAGLRRRIGAGRGEPGVAADARVVDDLPAPPLQHRRQQQLGQVHDRDQVDLEHRVDLVDVLLLEQAAGHEAGVVDEQVDVRQRRGATLDRLARREIERDGAHLTGAARRRRGRLEAVGVAHAVEQQVEPAGGELGGDRAADAAVRAGDECCESVQVHRSRVRGRLGKG